jgi:predicted CxxxxCH...CXXCH cytochrome family protein
MIRRAAPVSAPAASLYFETAAAFYNSSTYSQDGVYSNAVCDNQDCHGMIDGPGPISNLMNTLLPGAKHKGGVGFTSGCDSCHIHEDSGGSFRASNSCDTCHGQPPIVNSGGGPQGYAFVDTRSYASESYFKAEDQTPHAIHASPLPTGYGKACSICHLREIDAAYHNTSTGNPETFRNVIFDTSENPDALAEGANKYSPSYSITASSPNVCLNLYCHSDGQGFDPTPGNGRYNTAVASSQAWDGDNTTTVLDCESCHGSNRNDSTGDTFFGAPDYPTGSGGAGDSTYSPGSGVLASQTKANSHLDTTKHGR